MADRPNMRVNDSAQPKFQDSNEAAFRRIVHNAIRKGKFSKGNRDVILAVANLWLHYRNGPTPYIYPGRKALAKRAKVSVRTVASCLAFLRENGALVVVGYAKGGNGKATRYTISPAALFELCGCHLPDVIDGHLVPLAAPKVACKIAHKKASKMGSRTVQKLHTNINNVSHSLFHDGFYQIASRSGKVVFDLVEGGEK